MDCIPHGPDHRRNPISDHHGRPGIRLLLLRGRRHSSIHPPGYSPALLRAVFHLCLHLRAYVYRRSTGRADCGINCDTSILHVTYFLWCYAKVSSQAPQSLLKQLLIMMNSATALPGFWIFMYRVSPFTYWIAGMAATELHGERITCSADEVSVFNPPAGQTCGQYLAPYLTQSAGTLQNPDATTACSFCQLSVADELLGGFDIYWADRWRNFGIVWAYVLFNIAATVLLYYVFRVKGVKNLSFKKKSASKAADAAKTVANKPAHDEKAGDGSGDNAQSQTIV